MKMVTPSMGVRQVEMWAIERLRPYDKNPRKHTDDQVRQIAASITEFGFTNPILVDTKAGIVAGHGRLMAAQLLRLTEVPVIVLDHLSPEQCRAYIIADNRLAEQATWDDNLLIEALRAFEDADFDLTLTGFDEDELRDMLGDETEEVPTPDPLPDPITRPGDLWILGDHRLLCGDSANSTMVDRLLDGAPVHLVNTDPPYNCGVEPSAELAKCRHGSGCVAQWEGAQREKETNKGRRMAGDFVSDEAFEEMLLACFGNIARVLLPGRSFYIWGGYGNCANYPPALKSSKLHFSQAIVWVKEHPGVCRKDFMGNHESCFYGWREGAAHKFYGPSNAVDVWAVKKVNPQIMVHLTEKPVELAVRAIQYSSKPGENILDLFGGSGSTLIGAEQTNRTCFMMEIDSAYCDVIVQRWQTTTGRKATLETGGDTFEAVTAERKA